MAKADETGARLTRLWANRNKRVPGDTVAILFRFDARTSTTAVRRRCSSCASSSRRIPTWWWSWRATRTASATAPYNIQLSQRRSEAVRRFLVEKGVELHRIHSIGLGDIKPSADNATPKGREQNRRVMVRTFAPAE